MGQSLEQLWTHVTHTKKICEYSRIPFAAPPVGKLRFKPPKPVSSWKGTLNATGKACWCPHQFDVPKPAVDISEDCLYLDVYQPKNSKNNKLPVMIWIHGGGFTFGNGEIYSNSKLLGREKDVIIVIPQYRLGILGFFSTGNLVSPGNYGLKDQAFAIKWVYENIKDFGGNPKHITVFGESAGGASAMYHLLSPLSRGYLNSVIAQSGTALSNWAIGRNPAENGKIIARLLGCPTFSSVVVIECMRRASWQRIIQVQNIYIFMSLRNMNYPTAGITPVIEPWHPEAFIYEEPKQIMKYGNIPKIPVLLGSNKHDGSFGLAAIYGVKYMPESLDTDTDYLRNDMIPDLMKFGRIVEEEGNRGISSTVELASFRGVNRTCWKEIMPGLVDHFSVFGFKASIENSAGILSRRGLPVYLYSFEKHSNNSLQPFLGYGIPVEPGVGHGDELMYLFDFVAEEDQSKDDKSFESMFCDMWLNFAVLGNPTPSTSNVDTWSTYNTKDEFYMKLNNTPTLLKRYRKSWSPNGFEWN